jgi:hypothetical protein
LYCVLMAHFVPRDFKMPFIFGTALIQRPVTCSERLVENTVIQSKQGTVISLINWSGVPQKNLTVTVNVPGRTNRVSLASGGAVKMSEDGKRVFTLDLDVADALILR